MKKSNILIFAGLCALAAGLLFGLSNFGIGDSGEETASITSSAGVVSNWKSEATGSLISFAEHDWPQWLGPNRNGISSETGILTSFPESGPKVLWQAPSGDGYSGMSVLDGKLYTAFGSGSDEFVLCYDAKTGDELWRYRIDNKFTNQFGHGPRSTPTVHEGIVYAVSAQANLAALDANNGQVIWKHDLRSEYGAQIPTWGVATSPLVYKNMLLVDVGGKGDYGFVAFDKDDGSVVWKTETELPGYSAPIVVEVNGVRQALCFTGNKLISVNPDNGDFYWSYPWITSYDVNAATPVFIKPDKVFISSGYNVGGAVLRLVVKNNNVDFEEIWKSRVMRNHFSTSLLIDGHLYGFDEGTLRCVDVKTQETRWATRGFGKGSLMAADGHIILLSERGKLVLIEATPREYVEKSSAQMLKGRCWTIPTLVDGRLYIRNQKELLCLDFAG